MAVAFLDFEQPIAELEAKIEELKHIASEDSEVNIRDEITRLQAKSRQLTTHIFANLTPWQITQLARHPHRPYTLDYVNVMCHEFQELHGDRMFGDDLAIVGGLARLGDRAVMVLGHQKGRDTKERVRRNYGMPKPEGYRKALRLMRLAERFGLPLITFIDTPGAYPGVGSEERGQSEAIARNLFEMSVLRIPIITVVIGEGGSGGALAIGVCDRLLMLQYSTYSVITPEGCASILWKSAEKKEAAADAMGLTAQRLAQLGLIDEVLEEPLGGAHRDPAQMSETSEGRAHAPPRNSRRGEPRRAARGARRQNCRIRCVFRNPLVRRRVAAARFGPRWLRAHLRALLPNFSVRPICVAFSGGVDSTALLAALARIHAPQAARAARQSRPASERERVEQALPEICAQRWACR